MNKSKDMFINVRTLANFGSIVFIAILIVSVGIYKLALIDLQIGIIEKQSLKRSLLELIEYELLEEELAERRYVLHQDEESINLFDASEEQLIGHIEEFKKLSESDREIALLDEDRLTIRSNFEAIVKLVDRGELSIEKADQLVLKEQSVNNQLEDMVFEAGVTLQEDYEFGIHLIQRSSLLMILGMIVFPIFAVAAFYYADRLTGPLLSLTNAVMAARGSRYNINLLEGALHRQDGIGQLARAIDDVVNAVEKREEELKKELENIIEQARESRRRKLILTSRLKDSDQE